MLTYDGDFPDPYILRVGGDYFAYATQSGGMQVQVMTSTTLVSWRHLGEAFPQLPAWSKPGFTWSPAVLRRGDRFVMYVAVRERRYDRQAIATAVADHPAGPFRPLDADAGPLVFQPARGGSIDPDPFVDHDGRVYLVWKSDGELVGDRSALWILPLAPDGLSAAKRTCISRSRPRRLLRHDAPWERPLIEAPCLLHAGTGDYYLFYSAGQWPTAGYAVGYARGRSPRGPFTKVTTDRPWLASRPHAAGPGGQCMIDDTDGTTYLAYHAWDPDVIGYDVGGARKLHIDRLTISPDGPRLADEEP